MLRIYRSTLSASLEWSKLGLQLDEQAQPVLFDEVFRRQHLFLPEVVKRRSEEKLQVVVRDQSAAEGNAALQGIKLGNLFHLAFRAATL